ncbi:voltage-gated chloride channel [Gymnopilus junonius]|uniref:Chloride channel protein n=1 Tax=Gymnopilus junonius TaxID=109634 RepID=A0A9P5N7Z5_GYMJU|nr:voltage-gated chloride channel [Gymnopilus junonius]
MSDTTHDDAQLNTSESVDDLAMDPEELEDEELEEIRRYEDFTTIDWIQDSILERKRRLRTQRQKVHLSRWNRGSLTFLSLALSRFQTVILAGQSWIVLTLVGICIGLNAAVVSIVSEWLSDIKMGYCSDGWWLNEQFCCWEIEGEEIDGCDSWHSWSHVTLARWIIFVMFATTFSFIASHLVRSFAKYAAGSGISEIKCILAGFVMQGFLGFATFFIKSITLPLVIASGLSVGKEGPSVHVACCVGSLVAGLFETFRRSESKMREIVTAASAAGVAVAFGSPIGGVLFSIEEMSHTFSIKTMWKSIFCALVATFTLAAMNPFRTGKLVLFQVTYDRDWHFFEIIFFVILGIFGGLYGAFVIKFNVQVAAFRRKHLANHGVAEAVTLATLTALIGYFNRFLRLDMTSSMAILFKECEGGGNVFNLCQSSAQWRISNSLLLATIIRIGLVVITYGCKVPAGIFVPSMAIGATFGRMIGIVVKAMYNAYPNSGIFRSCAPDVPCITPGTYAFLGAAAALSGVMRITVTVVVIMFELTGALTYILPTMIVLLVTKAVGDFLGTNGIADEMIRFNGFPFLEKEDHVYNVTVSTVMRKDLNTLSETGMRVKDVESRLSSTNFKGFPIVSSDGSQTLVGYIDRSEIRYVLERARKNRGRLANTPCLFTSRQQEPDDIDMTSDAHDDDEPEEYFAPTTAGEGIQFWPWVNKTPMTVSPELPLEIVMQIFKRMGPRTILVENHGTLSGLVTVKDVLKFIATEKPDYRPSWDERGGLDGLLEEVWTWASTIISRTVLWSRRVLRR